MPACLNTLNLAGGIDSASPCFSAMCWQIAGTRQTLLHARAVVLGGDLPHILHHTSDQGFLLLFPTALAAAGRFQVGETKRTLLPASAVLTGFAFMQALTSPAVL